VPLEVCWALWDDRERIPQWMPWIKSVKVLQEDPRLSRWTLSTQQFGRWGRQLMLRYRDKQQQRRGQLGDYC
jgi:uncharacterized membrane protein